LIFVTLWFAKTVESGGDLYSDLFLRNANYADQHKKPIGETTQSAKTFSAKPIDFF
jgi:hypothetical protein